VLELTGFILRRRGKQEEGLLFLQLLHAPSLRWLPLERSLTAFGVTEKIR